MFNFLPVLCSKNTIKSNLGLKTNKIFFSDFCDWSAQLLVVKIIWCRRQKVKKIHSFASAALNQNKLGLKPNLSMLMLAYITRKIPFAACYDNHVSNKNSKIPFKMSSQICIQYFDYKLNKKLPWTGERGYSTFHQHQPILKTGRLLYGIPSSLIILE